MKNKVITAVIKGSGTAYLSAIFEDNKLVGIVQNKNVSSEVNSEHVAKFLLAINNDEYFYPKNIAEFIEDNVTVIESIDVVNDFIEVIDF